jgi:LysR family transcriptional regulator, hydrogen peroxide-inducible genes activator
MTYTQLHYLLAIDTHRHFGKAAESCFVTQPSMSMQIQKLEEELEVLIFDRSKKPVEPTEIGKQIIAQAREAIREMDKIAEMVNHSKGIVRGEFRVGVIPTVASSLLHRLIPEFTKKFPDVKLIIEEWQTETIISRLKKDLLDAAIAATPLQIQGIIEMPVYYEPFVAFIPENHRLSSESFVLNSELKLEDILLLKEGHCFRDNVINLCKSAFEQETTADKKHFMLESGSFETLVRLSKRGLGMTLIPYLTAEDLSTADKKMVKPFDYPQPSREISIIYSRSQLKINLIQALSNVIQDVVPKKLKEPQEHNIVSPVRL